MGINFTGTKYAPSYDDLDATDYKNAWLRYQANDSYTLFHYGNNSKRNYVVVSTTKESGSNLNDYLDDAVANYSAYGGTYTSYGVNMANKVFANNTPLSRIVQVKPKTASELSCFTDGEPGANGYSKSIAGEARWWEGNPAKSGATVYTIGLFPEILPNK